MSVTRIVDSDLHDAKRGEVHDGGFSAPAEHTQLLADQLELKLAELREDRAEAETATADQPPRERPAWTSGSALVGPVSRGPEFSEVFSPGVHSGFGSSFDVVRAQAVAVCRAF